jgi:glycolate oxidase iron-sulfur subunit
MISRRPGDCKPTEPYMLASLAMAVAPTAADVDPDRAGGIEALADRCVQCGLCLPHCPTYQLERQEAESPRGRIALWRALSSGQLDASPGADLHLDHCLGCRACESVCPAGVRYGDLLVRGRALQRERRRPAWTQRNLERLAARPRLLDVLLGAYRWFQPWLPPALRPLPAPPRPVRAAPATPLEQPATTPAIALFEGCVGRRYDAPARSALVQLLQAAGLDAHRVAGQTCCGALHAHAGDMGTAKRLAGINRGAFAGHSRVCTTAPGCHEALAAALDGTTEVADPFVVLARAGDRLRFRRADQRVALHLPCTQQRQPDSVIALRALLSRLPGLELVELPAACCGAAGSQMLTDPTRAARFRQPLLDAARDSGAATLLSANIGCRLHLGNASPVPVRHPLEFLAEHLQ